MNLQQNNIRPANKPHPALGISMLALSNLFERMCYYGMRSIFVLFMVRKLNLPDGDATMYYSLLITIMFILPILGGLIGDFALTPVICMIIGGGMQSLGCFIIAFPNEITFLAGMLFIALGGSFYKPNVLKQTAVLYHDRFNLIDSGYSIQYTAINIGAFMATTLIGGLASQTGASAFGGIDMYSVGFIIAGFCGLLSIIPLIISYSEQKNKFTQFSAAPKTYSPIGIISLIGVLLMVPFFWMTYEALGSFAFECQKENAAFQQVLFLIITVVLSGPVLSILWSFFRFDSLYKLSAGFFIWKLTFLLFAFVSPCFIGLQFGNVIAEVLIIAPSMAIIARFSPPYLTGTFFALSILLSGLALKYTYVLESLIRFNLEGSVTLICVTSFVITVICIVAALLLPKQFSSQK